MKKIQTKNYLNRTAQTNPTSNVPPQPPMGEDDFDDIPDPPRKDKEYFASIGVRIRVASGNPQQELQFAQQAFEAIKEQIQRGVNEDSFEAWLSGHDEEPKTMNQLSGGMM